MSIDLFQQAIASLFKRKGKDILPTHELELLASMELRWFEPAEARKLIELALNMGVLEDTGDGLKPTFDTNSIDIPLGFKPPISLLNNLEHEQESLFMQLVNYISINSDLDSKEIVAKINDRQASLGELVTLETIAILFGIEQDLDMEEFIPKVKSNLLAN